MHSYIWRNILALKMLLPRLAIAGAAPASIRREVAYRRVQLIGVTLLLALGTRKVLLVPAVVAVDAGWREDLVPLIGDCGNQFTARDRAHPAAESAETSARQRLLL